jgi:hypothetical protein
VTRFDDAVLDLMAHLPPDTDMDGLRKRVRRHRRKHAIAAVAVIGVISVASISVAASLGRKSSGPVVAVSPTTTVPATSERCVRLPRNYAVARVMHLSDVVDKHDTVHAKLMTWSELHQHSGPLSRINSINNSRLLWVVEVQGAVRPEFAQGTTTYTWEVVAVDANSDDIKYTTAGSGVAPPYWNALPDHGSECTATAVAATTTTTPTRTTTGHTPTRDATAEAAITTAFLGWIDAQPHDAVQQYVQGYASIADPLRQGMAQHTSAALTEYTGRVDSVSVVDATHAKVRYTILFSGQPQYERLPGEALKIDGRWVVSRNTVCDLLAKGNIICPL